MNLGGIMNIILVGIGGFIGAVSRYGVGQLVAKYVSSAFPCSTFVVNIVGCLLIGLLSGLFKGQLISEEVKLLMVTGFCGAFTTFSTFSNEGLLMLRGGDYGMYVLYVVLSVLLGIAATALGYIIAK